MGELNKADEVLGEHTEAAAAVEPRSADSSAFPSPTARNIYFPVTASAK